MATYDESNLNVINAPAYSASCDVFVLEPHVSTSELVLTPLSSIENTVELPIDLTWDEHLIQSESQVNDRVNDQENIETVPDVIVTSNNGDTRNRQTNYAFQALSLTGEGELLIKIFDFEQNRENLKALIDSKKRSFFSINKVAKIIVYHEIHRTKCFDISSARFEELAEAIVQLFPTYLKETLYTGRANNSRAHGALQNSYENIRLKAFAIKLIKDKSRKRKSEGDTVSEEFENLKIQVNTIDPDYIKKWSKTAKEERIEFYKNNTTECIFSTFQNLKNPLGYLLVRADFCSFFSKSENVFCENWPETAVKIIEISKTKTNDKVIRKILLDNKSCLDNGNIQILALYLLPFLFKKIIKQTVKNRGGKNWFPEKEEVLNTFILHIKETDNFYSVLEQKKSQLKQMHVDHKLEFHPYIVVINGASLSTITSSYVIINDVIYQVHSVPYAVDVCFQFMRVLQKQFPIISNHIWQFLEKQVYNFPTSSSLLKGVSDLIYSLQS